MRYSSTERILVVLVAAFFLYAGLGSLCASASDVDPASCCAASQSCRSDAANLDPETCCLQQERSKSVLLTDVRHELDLPVSLLATPLSFESNAELAVGLDRGGEISQNPPALSRTLDLEIHHSSLLI